MSLDYTGSAQGLFRHLGKLIKYFNKYKADATDATNGLDANRKDIYDAIEAGDLELTIDGLATAFEQWKQDIVGRRATLSSYMVRRLRDRNTVLDQIGAVSTDVSEIMSKLISQMLIDSQTVQASSVSLGSVAAAGSNAGNGQLVVTKVLDGYSSPGSANGLGFLPQRSYVGLNSELAVPSETMKVQCVEDSFGYQGAVAFRWQGRSPDTAGQFGIAAEGSGDIGLLYEIHSATSNFLTNADFEDFTVANLPDGWVAEAGTVGTHIKANSTAAKVAHGSKSLQLVGDGTQATIKLSQAFGTGSLNTNRMYLVSAQIIADASIGAGTLTIQLEGTGYTPGSTEKIEIASGSLPTSFQLKTFLVMLPASLPDDLKLVVKWDGTPSSGKNLYVDDLGMAPIQYGGGVGAAVVRGTVPFSKGDSYSFTVANTEGLFQRAFRQIFGVQLPSSGSPTISDSLI